MNKSIVIRDNTSPTDHDRYVIDYFDGINTNWFTAYSYEFKDNHLRFMDQRQEIIKSFGLSNVDVDVFCKKN